MSDSADVPQLNDDGDAFLMDGVNNLTPTFGMLLVPESRSMGPLGTLMANEGTFRQDQPGSTSFRTLSVVLDVFFIGDGIC